MPDPRPIWTDADPPAGDQWVAFRREFTSDGTPGTLRLFAESRYRLCIDGRPVFHGPTRYVPGTERHDVVPLDLPPGPHALEVVVRRQVVSNFQNLPGPAGGFIVWGEAGGVSLATPGGWRVSDRTPWRDDTPTASFALGPAEHRTADTPGPWREPVVVERPGWAGMPERDVPLPSADLLPVRETGRRGLAAFETHGFTLDGITGKPEVGVRTFLHADEPRTVTLLHGWGDWSLNGRPLQTARNPHGTRTATPLDLRPGWNEVFGRFVVLPPRFAVIVGVAGGAAMRGRPSEGCEVPLQRTPLLPKVPADPAEVTDWLDVPAERPAAARLLSFDAPGDGPETLHSFDAGGEFLGRLVIDVDAEPGAVLDVGWDERLTDDGRIAYYACNPQLNAADRYVCRGGPERIVGFEPRGGRYVEVAARGRAEVKAVHVEPASCVPPVVAEFECDDDLLNWVFETGVRTVRASTEDVFVDCPWRERGTYLGDAAVQAPMHRLLTGDATVPARTLRLFAHARRGDGQLPCVVPAHLRGPHADFTLRFPAVLLDHVRATGDLDLARECWPAVTGLLASDTWQFAASGLLDSPQHLRPFVDWGALKLTALADENAVLNAYRIEALRSAATLADMLDQDVEFAEQAEEATGLFRDRLWLGDGFAAGRQDGRPVRGGPHADVVALRLGLAPAGEEAALIAAVAGHLRDNPQRVRTLGRAGGFLELYFLVQAYDALYDAGEVAAAEAAIREHYRPMRDGGAWTFWECLHRGDVGLGSLCHGWSAGGTTALLTRTLGVTVTPAAVTVRPQAETVGWARGVVAHPVGPIRVEWSRGGKPKVDAPAGVAVTLQ